jgi:hypothetical protein
VRRPCFGYLAAYIRKSPIGDVLRKLAFGNAISVRRLETKAVAEVKMLAIGAAGAFRQDRCGLRAHRPEHGQQDKSGAPSQPFHKIPHKVQIEKEGHEAPADRTIAVKTNPPPNLLLFSALVKSDLRQSKWVVSCLHETANGACISEDYRAIARSSRWSRPIVKLLLSACHGDKSG